MQTVESINKQLKENFGIDTISSNPIFRIVWSEDQTEKRIVNTTDSGVALLFPEMRLQRKYNYIVERYLLERLNVIPEIQRTELGGLKISYEPLFIFEDRNNFPLPPKYEVCEFVIHTIFAAMGKGNLAQYKEASGEEAIEEKRKRVDSLVRDIYGNETDVSDHLTRKTGIIVPGGYEK